MKKYVVFVGRIVGIYHSWAECKKQVDGFKGAIFKSFPNYTLALTEFEKFNRSKGLSGKVDINYTKPSFGVCSDASYLIKKNVLEYRVVDIKTNEILSHGIFEDAESKYLTNIGEFFGLVRAIKYVIDKKLDVPIYCDSVTAIKWVTEKKVKTSCTDNRFVSKIKAGIEYLKKNELPNIYKWQTDLWGEIPADFGRK